MKNLNATIGENIRIALAKQGFTQAELAINLGFGKNTISEITKGWRSLSATELVRVTEFFGTSITWFTEEHISEIQNKAA
ncbi:helix-turn-helix transcriptional regulator [Rothia amarae]|uniref:Helix-turn-helix transcriptional regulator n=1 Tax=Rothia amarae TaxID=169480 RepID=A0A7H2BHF8_9MICC|nr:MULTISPECIES: helix-turn-helix transcriptional regulator [Rothia]QNV39104.1 helix-turn-helix transcriptional regulator [Rothia amarae]